MSPKTINILKNIAIVVFVPTVLVVGYYGIPKLVNFVKKKREDKLKVVDVKKVEGTKVEEAKKDDDVPLAKETTVEIPKSEPKE